MPSEPCGQGLVNNFALVCYLPDPLGEFLDKLRKELVPGCAPHAHVTILPPRQLSGTPEAAIETVRSRMPDFSPFEVRTGEVEVFEASDVVYLGIAHGSAELTKMHQALDVGPLRYSEPYSYHPHVTLAQDLTREQSIELAARARRRWSEFTHARAFQVETLVFVQNTTGRVWVDLAHFQLDTAPSIRR